MAKIRKKNHIFSLYTNLFFKWTSKALFKDSNGLFSCPVFVGSWCTKVQLTHHTTRFLRKKNIKHLTKPKIFRNFALAIWKFPCQFSHLSERRHFFTSLPNFLHKFLLPIDQFLLPIHQFLLSIDQFQQAIEIVTYTD